MAEYIQVAGYSKIYVAWRAGSGSNAMTTPVKIGEQMDETQLAVQQAFHDVPGDRHGGPQGPPIERQLLGLSVTGQLNLSRWDPAVADQLRRHNAMGTVGTIADAEIGSLMLRDNSFRICIVPSRANPVASPGTGDYFAWNFPCCCIASPIEHGQGTKFSVLRLSFQAFRVPDGHPASDDGVSTGVVWDRNLSGVPGIT